MTEESRTFDLVSVPGVQKTGKKEGMREALLLIRTPPPFVSSPFFVVIPPQILTEEYPLSIKAAETILTGRREVDAALKGHDDRLVVVVGPCSVHDVAAGLEYARLLKDYAETAKEDLCIVMR